MVTDERMWEAVVVNELQAKDLEAKQALQWLVDFLGSSAAAGRFLNLDFSGGGPQPGADRSPTQALEPHAEGNPGRDADHPAAALRQSSGEARVDRRKLGGAGQGAEAGHHRGPG